MTQFLNNIIDNKIWEKGSLTFYTALVSVILLPVYHYYLPPFMILWGTLWLLEIIIRKENFRNVSSYNKRLFFLFILFFAWQVFGMLYSDSPKEGWRNIILRMSLFLFPLVLFSPGEMIKRKVSVLLKVFALSAFSYLLICFAYALFRSISIKNGTLNFFPHPPVESWLNYFYASELTIKQHPSYLSMYVLLAVFIAIESFIDKEKKPISRISWLIICIVLAISVYLLSSRAEILAAVISVPVYFIYKFKKSGKKQILVFLLVMIVIILIPLSISNPRFKNYYKQDSGKEIVAKSLEESRLRLWNASFIIISKNILFGVGTGDIQSELNKEYDRLGYKDILKVGDQNAHNQFIEIAAEHGMVGLIIFLAIFIYITVIAISNDNPLYLIFIVIVFISFLFETMLNRLGGVTFFSLFSFLLLHINMKDKNISPD